MKEKILSEVLDYVKLIGFVIIITTILNTLVFTFSTVKQSSMETTLMPSDVLIIEKTSYLFGTPDYGDIIVFVEDEPVTENLVKRVQVLFSDMYHKIIKDGQRTRLVKRVIGLPGDEIDLADGRVYVNGEMIEEPYVEDPTLERLVKYPYTVSEGHYFVMGDNRDVSKDSRHFGEISVDNIEGKAVFRLSPFSKFGLIH